jgi:hypothetical protein
VPGAPFGLWTENRVDRGENDRVKTRPRFTGCADSTPSRTVYDLDGFDKPDLDEYNPLYIKTTRGW